MRIPRRKRSKRTFSRIQHFPGIVLSLLLIVLLAYVLGWSQLLSLKEIAINGTGQVSVITEEISSVKPSIRIGEPLARIDVHAIERAITKSTWIENVRVGRNWLNGKLTIAVVEKKPVASYLLPDSSMGYFDAKGEDFTSPLSYSGVPIINLYSTSISAKQSIANLLTALPGSFLENAQSFAVKSANDLEMTVALSKKRTIRIIWGDSSDLSLKIQVYEKLLAMKENSQSKIFNLSDPLSPITK